MDTYFAAVPSLAPSGQPGLSEWKSLARQGMQARRSGNIPGAQGFYLQALHLAQALLQASYGSSCSTDDRMAAFVVSHLNLADLHAELDEITTAANWLCKAHQTLMDCLCDPQADAELQQAACRHSRETHAALLAHLAEHGSHPCIVQALHAGCLPFTHAQAPHALLH